MNFPTALATIADACSRLIDEYAPDAVVLEKLFFSNNQKTAMRVAEVRGALIETATRLGVSVFEYSPGEVKSAAAGSGRADKYAVAMMVRALLKITKPIKHDDEYDAIAMVLHTSHTSVNSEGCQKKLQ